MKEHVSHSFTQHTPQESHLNLPPSQRWGGSCELCPPLGSSCLGGFQFTGESQTIKLKQTDKLNSRSCSIFCETSDRGRRLYFTGRQGGGLSENPRAVLRAREPGPNTCEKNPGKGDPGRGGSKCKGPEAGKSLRPQVQRQP